MAKSNISLRKKILGFLEIHQSYSGREISDAIGVPKIDVLRELSLMNNEGIIDAQAIKGTLIKRYKLISP